ncbi:MAG: D-glycero-alpha-D-manno-heptose-1,7-bisphosphate 7-phosphatase [Myxococcota bacterium]
MGRAGVFLDRDGTIIEDVGYLDTADRLRLLPRAAEAVRLLNAAGLVTIVISNQSGVARGYFPEERVQQVHARLASVLAGEGARLDAIYYCPHHPDFGPPALRVACDCRKPRTGMIERGAAEFGLDAARCYVVGDKGTDVACARRAGAIGVLVHGGGGVEPPAKEPVAADHEAADLFEAASWIVSRERGQGVPHGGRNTACKT